MKTNPNRFLVFALTFTIISPVLAGVRVALETDNKGKVIQGSYQELRDWVSTGAELRIGLGTETYNEVVFLQSVLLSKSNIIGVQSLLTSWHRDSLERMPYRTAIMISTDLEDSFVRFNLDGQNMDLRPSHSKGRYDYFRWFVETDRWKQIYSSEDKNRAEQARLVKRLETSGQDVKVSFELNGVTYILKPYIVIFPKPGKYSDPRALPVVRTYPTIIFEDDPFISINKWKSLSLAEVSIHLSDDVAVFNYVHFKINLEDLGFIDRWKLRIKTRSMKVPVFGDVSTTPQIKLVHLKSPVKWFVRE